MQVATVCITVYVPAVATEMDAVVSPVLHNSDPVKPDAVNTELPQLLTTDTSGVGADVSGDAIPCADGLVHPFNICATVYVPPVVTVIVEVVSPVLHNNDPVNADAVNTELPQLLTTVTIGVCVAGVFGAAVALPNVPVHPLTVCVTVYIPAVVTVIDSVVSPVFHNSDPLVPDAVKTELPQLFRTETVGSNGMLFGAATAFAGALVQPFTVCVTVYVPALITVMDGDVAPLLHSNVPPNVTAVNSELPQLFTTLICGAKIELTVSVAGFELAGPSLFVQTARYCLLLSAAETVKVNVALTAPFISDQVIPSLLVCHFTTGVPPVALELKLTFAPEQTLWETGCVVIVGGTAVTEMLPLISSNEVLACCVEGKLTPSVYAPAVVAAFV